MEPREIQRPVQLLVEGNDARNFFEAFTTHLGLETVQIQNYGGINDLGGFLEALVVAPRFTEVVASLGVVRDAERPPEGAEPETTAASGVRLGGEMAARAFQSVTDSLRGVGLAEPERPAARTDSNPATGVFILPGDGEDGMLETLLCQTFADTELDRCVDAFFRCAKAAARREAGRAAVAGRLARPEKSRARAFLATTGEPQLSVGVAAKRGLWNLDHDAFAGVRRFLSDLAAARPAA